MERPEYYGIKYYGPDDKSVGYYYEKAVQILTSIEPEKEYENINEVIELYEIHRLFQSPCLREEYVKPYGHEIKSLMNIVAKYFNKITSENFYQQYCNVCINYIGAFWKAVDEFHVYNNISNEVFADLLGQPDTTLYMILENKNIVKRYDNVIAENMRTSNQSARIIVSKFLEKKDENRQTECYLPTSLLPQEYEKILARYIDSPDANVGIIQLIAQSQNTGECPISDRLKLQAKRKAEEYWEKRKGVGVSIEYEICISYEKRDELITLVQEKPCHFKCIYDIKWLENNLDYPTILNNFIYLFGYVDLCGRSQFPAQNSKLGVFERVLGVKGIKEYITGSEFEIKDMKSSAEMRAYKDFLSRRGIRIEDVIQWFFNDYLADEFSANGFVFNGPTEGSSLLEKCRSIPSEMDGILKQYRMYVEDGEIDRELLEMSSNPVVLGELPSFIDHKYAYANSVEIKNEQNLLFSDQCMLAYVPKYGEQYNCFFDLLSANKVSINDYRDYDKPQLEWLIERGTISIGNDGVIILNREKAQILRGLFYSGVICPSYYNTPIIQELVDSGELVYESKLFSRPEKKYLNYILNKSEFGNGLDLRNKYIHSTYPIEESVQEYDYIYLLKVMIMVVLKMNEEFCLKAGINGKTKKD